MIKKLEIPAIPSLLIWLAAPAVSFYLLESLTHSVSENMGVPLIILNLVFYYLVYGLILVISKRSWVSLSLGTLFFMIVGLVNYYVIDFRSVPLYPWDIFSIKVAASVSGNYDYHLEPETMKLVLGFLMLILIGLLTRFKLTIRKRTYHVAASAAVLGLIWIYASMVQMPAVHSAVGFYEYLFTPNAFCRKNGFMVSFLSNMQYLEVPVPDGYSAEKAEEILSHYVEESHLKKPGISEKEQPNVIVIMNEAFSDLSVLGDFETNMDYMPYIHAMDENTIKGTAAVSVKGGNTANTEYEFLTGDTMAWLPVGSIPYQQYIRGEMPSVASQLNNLGYMTCAMHPYGANGWNRQQVYEYFGFEQSYFKSSFQDAPVLREYVTDLATYQKIIDIYNTKEEGRPMFVFDVTMQNHSSYSKEYTNFTPDVEVYGSRNDQLLERYLSLIRVSDEAFGALVDYFKGQDEPTIILMFGDHQPADWVVKPIYENNGITDSSLWSESPERYEVPFIIWANYDIDEEQIQQEVNDAAGGKGILSVNYLSTLLFETAELPMSAYQLFMKELADEYPVITANVVYDKDGSAHNATDAESLTDQLKAFWILNYNNLFDAENRKDEWYE